MKWKEIRIRQFGPLREQALENLDGHKLILIAGKNRAGKSVLMEAVRSLPVGYSRSGRFKEFGKTAQVEATAASGARLKAQGYAQPDVVNADGAPGRVSDVLADPQLVRGLYTIDLSDLMTAGSSDFVSQVLLGGGEKELESLPNLIKSYEKKYKELGGERGTSGEMAGAKKAVEAALAKRAAASAQVEGYREAHRVYNETVSRLKACEEETEALTARLEDLKALYNLQGTYEAIRREEEALSTDPVREARYRLTASDRERLKILKEEAREEIETTQRLEQELSAFQRVGDVDLTDARNYLNEQVDRTQRVARANARMEQAVSYRQQLERDLQEELGNPLTLSELENMELDRARIEHARELSRRAKNEAEGRAKAEEAARNRGSHSRIIALAGAAIMAIVATGLAFLWTPTAAIPLMLGAVFALYLYVKKENKLPVSAPITDPLAETKSAFHLPTDCPDEVLFGRMEAVLDLKHRAFSLKTMLREAERAADAVHRERLAAAETFAALDGGANLPDGAWFMKLAESLTTLLEGDKRRRDLRRQQEKCQNILTELENLGFADSPGLFTELELALRESEKYEAYRTGLTQLENRKAALKENLSLRFGDVPAAELYAPFGAGRSLPVCVQEAEGKVKQQRELADQLRQKRAELRVQMERFASPEALDAAKRELDAAREQMRSLALRYARYRLAAQVTRDFYEETVENRQATLLKDGWDTFKAITAGAYDRFYPDLSGKDVEFMAKAGDAALPTLALSRGTAEELFLSVRLGRMKTLGLDLPILLDDALVNFDRDHRVRAFTAIRDAVGDSQVFYFTCHGTMAREAADAFGDVLCFVLEDGKLRPETLENTLALLEGDRQ